MRFHLPIQTNDEAELHLDGLVYQLKTGVIYLVNQGCVHAAQNHGPRTRVHLVWDSLLTEELYAFLFQNRFVSPGLSAYGANIRMSRMILLSENITDNALV